MDIYISETNEIERYSLEDIKQSRPNWIGSIILLPTYWDDYGYRTGYYSYYISPHKGVISLGHVKIGKKGSTAKIYGEGVHPDLEDGKPLSTDLFSLGTGEEYYRDLESLRHEGDQIFHGYLSSMNDIIYKDIYEEVKEENVFQRSLLRGIPIGNVLVTYNNILKGINPRTEYKFQYSIKHKLATKNTFLEISVLPQEYTPTNIHVLIGRNGVGKTTILLEIANKLLSIQNSRDVDVTASPINNFSSLVAMSFSSYDEYPKEDEYTINYNYIGVRVSNQEEYNQSPSIHSYPEYFDKFVREDFLDNFNTILGPFNSKKDIYLKCLDILNNDPMFQESGIRELVNEYIIKVNEYQKTQTVLLLAENIKKAFNEIFTGKVGKIFDKMSSGHKSVLRSITKMVNCISVNSLILIDEPENHLHPPLLSSFIHALAYLLSSQNSVAIISTHSPVVLQEVPKKCVYKLTRAGYEFTAKHPSIEPFGENVGILTHEVFELEVTNTGFYSLLEKLASDSENYKDALNKLDNRLGAEGRVFLRGLVHEKNRERQEDMN